jgi:hypothetical protein
MSRGHINLCPGGPGSLQLVVCASGDTVDVGGFLAGGWLSGAVVVGFVSGAAAFFPQRWQKVLLSGSGVPHSVQKCMGVDRLCGGMCFGFGENK